MSLIQPSLGIRGNYQIYLLYITIMACVELAFNIDMKRVLAKVGELAMWPMRLRIGDRDMSKVLAMARECSKWLQLGNWEVVLLKEDGPTVDSLDVIASIPLNKQETVTEYVRLVSWILSYNAAVPEWAWKSSRTNSAQALQSLILNLIYFRDNRTINLFRTE